MRLKIGVLLISFIFLVGCSSVPKKVKLESSDPQVVVNHIERLKRELRETNSDVLAKRSFRKGDNEYQKALEGISERESDEKVLALLAQSKAYFLEAKNIAKSRTVIPESIMTARKAAINARLLDNSSLREKLHNVDESLIRDSSTFSKSLSPKRLSYFQSKYQKLEIEAVQNNQLGPLKKIISKAEESNGENLAPRTLTEANKNVYLAENLISQSSRDPSQFSESVEKAKKSVKLLDDVMDKLTGEAKGATEATALKMVYQEQKLGDLSDKVGTLQSSLDKSSTEIGDMHNTLAEQEHEISSTRGKIKFQEAMNEVRKSFKESEASVYQQGDNLIIRLKKIDFKPSDASVPTDSIAFLSRLNSVITKLKPDEIVVEGHTDSTGRTANNLLLSNKRANAVKEYLSSLDVNYKIDARGFGESKPIADNKTKFGRALNRRVDIVVKGK